MGRSTKAASPGPGHNVTELTDDEAGALVVHYELRIREKQRKVDAIMVDLKAARDAVNGEFKMVAKDLKYTRKEFEAEVIAIGEMTDVEYRNREARRRRLHKLAGRSVGEQLDLIDAINDTVDEANAAEHDGYRAGRRGDDPTPPKETASVLVQDWMRGYHAGQEFNRTQLLIAAEVLARPKPGEMAAAPEGEGDAEEDPGDPEVIKRKAAALEADGWAAPTEAEAKFEEADNGRTVRAVDKAA